MEEIQIRTGSFRPVFAYLATHMEKLEYLHLNALWEKKMIHFDAPGEPHYPSTKRSRGPNTITRTGADARVLIKYNHGRGVAMGTVMCNRWFRERQIQYGPPGDPM